MPSTFRKCRSANRRLGASCGVWGPAVITSAAGRAGSGLYVFAA